MICSIILFQTKNRVITFWPTQQVSVLIVEENSLKTDPDVYQDINSKFEISILNLN